MSQSKRIVVQVPSQLLAEVDGLVAMDQASRSELIREAVRIYVDERKRRDMRGRMAKGYQEMARLNLALAEGSER
jgi:CopG family transcriptional regulator/antitoxin EndoAI